MRKLAVLGLGLVLWAQSLPESDCINAIPVCQQTYTYTNSPPDFGQTQELANNTCLLNNEQKTVWFIFTVQQSGTFGFTINTSYDYDFALWDISNSSCAIVGNTTPIRCNFSADNGNTGLDASNPQAGSLSWDASQPPIMPGLNVTAGQTFVLVLDNYTRDQTGFTITFSGTAQIFDNTPPTLVSARQDCNRTNRIILRFNEPVSCSTVAANGSDFSISGGLNVVAAGCIGGGLYSYEVWIDVGGTISSGTYTITLQAGSDGNTVADKCGNFAAAGQSVQVSVIGSLSVTVTPREICVNDPGGVQLQGSIAGGLPPGAVASWSTGATGLTTQAFPSSASPYFEEPYWAYYTLTVTLGSCTYSVTDSVQVHPLPQAELVPAVVYTCGGRPVELTGLASILGGTWETRQPSGSWQALPAPVVLEPGVHQVRYRTPAGCIGETLTVEVIDAPISQGACNVLYVTPTGSSTASGTPDEPTSLEAALARLPCRKGLIKLAQGTYILTRPITTVTDSIIIEGGYDPAAGWVKRSTPGLTVLRRTATNVEGCPTLSPRLTAFQIHGAKAFRLQDLTIEVESAPAANAACADGRGISTYGLYLRDCGGYEIVRCQLLVGDASAGEAGTPGQDGRSGGNGQCGGAGAAATPAFGGFCLPPLGTPPPASAGAGGLGGSSPVGSAGGSGGSSTFMNNGSGGQSGGGPGGGTGGTAGSLCFTGLIGGGNCACTQVPLPGVPPASGGNGQDGQSGLPGQNGASGTSGQIIEGFWRPGSRGKPGQDGTHGSGGGGGGAGGGGSNIVPPSCPTIGAGGGGGGGGGEGGKGGKGGSGGGSSFAAALVGNGAGSAWIQCFLSAGQAGAGGPGGTGGQGGAGGLGAGPCAAFDGGCNAGNGGKGGNGGRGGNGGQGGSGQPGQAQPLLQTGTPPTLTEVTFNLSAQPTIEVGTAHCTGVDITFSSSAPGSFTSLGADASPTSLPANAGTAQYTAPGAKDLTFAGQDYPRFWTILTSPDQISLQILPPEDTFCAGTVTLFSSEAFALGYEWTVEQNGQPVPFQANRDTLRFTAQVGRYAVRLRVQTICCGWVGPVAKEITVIEAPVIRAEGATGCFPLVLQADLVSGVAGGTFVWYDSRGDSVGTGGQLILPGPVADSTYAVEYRAGSCRSSRVSVPVQGVPTPVLTGVTTTPPLQPAPEGPVNIDFTALYQAPAGSPVKFTWFFGDGGQLSSTQPQASHLYSPGVYTLTLIAAIGDCRDTLTVTVEVLGSRQLIIPNVFTPNGDGINDVWIPVSAGIRRMDIRIYDRWGRVLYQGAGPWRGEEAIEGVYTYVVEVEFLDGSRVSRAGMVTLLR